jgi:hypothetical protein
MGDFNYAMNPDDPERKTAWHSITFDPDGLNLNTWNTWAMAPRSRPFVNAPQIKESYVDVPGADGSLDYTEALTGRVNYANRTGSWEFIIDNVWKWHQVYSDILTRLHGKKFNKIVLTDDPEYYWKGRITVSGNFGTRDYSSVTLSYNLEPYKYPINKTTTPSWKWNDLFGTKIRFGPFNVFGEVYKDIHNDMDKSVVANIICSAPMKLYPCTHHDLGEPGLYELLVNGTEGYDNIKVDLQAGSNYFTLTPGRNALFFVGNGTIRVDYERGGIL